MKNGFLGLVVKPKNDGIVAMVEARLIQLEMVVGGGGNSGRVWWFAS